MFNKKKKAIIAEEVTVVQSLPNDLAITEAPKEEVNEEEWVWVEGFKGLDCNMQGYNNFQYELGKTYEMDSTVEIKPCKAGFHFCLSLDDVMQYYHYTSAGFTHRYFKVKGLVRKSDLEKYGKVEEPSVSCTNTKGIQIYSSFPQRIDKLAAKSIIILEEVPKEEIWEKYIQPNTKTLWYLTKEKYLANNNNKDKLQDWQKECLFNDINSLNIITNEEVINILIDKIFKNYNGVIKAWQLHVSAIHERLMFLKNMDCGKDMKCYLFYSTFQDLLKI